MEATIGGDKDDYLKALHLLPDGGFALTGTFASTHNAIGPNSGLLDLFVQRYSATGALLWTRTFGYETYTISM